MSRTSDSDSEGELQPCMREIYTLNDLFQAFAIDYRSSVRSHLPSIEARTTLSTWTDDTSNNIVRRSVFNLYKRLFMKISTLVCGEAGDASLFAVAKRIVEQSKGNDEKEAVNKEKDKYQKALVELLSKVKSKTIPYRTLRAVLVSTGTRKEVKRVVVDNSTLKWSSDGFSSGRKDLRLLQAGFVLTSTQRTLVRFKPSNVDIAIRNILSARNVSFVSWGTIKLKYNGVLYEFPRVTRKVIKKDIYLNYRDNSDIAPHRQLKRTNFFKLVSLLTHSEAKVRTAVDYVTGILVNDTYAILNRITALFSTDVSERQTLEVELKIAETWLKYGISYHIGDSSTCAAHVIAIGLAPIKGNKSSVENDVSSKCSSSYNSECEDTELLESDDDGTNLQESEDDNIEMQEIGASNQENLTNGDVEMREINTEINNEPDCSLPIKDAIASCGSCKHLFYVMDHLKKLVKKSQEKATDSALRALRNCKKKVKLFMGHKIRVRNQQLAIEKILEDMKKELIDTGTFSTCLITLDFKMKFDAKYFRELTLMFYGKRGMSWHDAMIQYYTLEVIDGVPQPFLQKIYMDHIICNENKQDKAAVFSILEAIIMSRLYIQLFALQIECDLTYFISGLQDNYLS